MIGVDGMEMPKSKYFAIIAVAGFVIAFIEPIILLLLGDDLGGAFWPMAIRTLELTLYLRENRSIVFALTIILTLTALVYNRSENPISVMVATFSVGLVFGLLAVFKLLDMAYMRGAFILLPTLYGFLILILSFKLYGIPKNAKWGEEVTIKNAKKIYGPLITKNKKKFMDILTKQMKLIK